MDLNFWRRDGNDTLNLASDKNLESVATPSPEYFAPDPGDPEKAKFYNGISRWILYAGIFLFPLFFLPWTTGVLELNKQLLLILVASAGLVSWLLGIVSSGWLNWRSNPLNKGVIVLLAGFAVSSAFSLSWFKSLFGISTSLSNGLVSILGLTILYFLIINNVEDRGKQLKSILGLSVVLALLYGILQIFGVYAVRLPAALSQAFNSVGSVHALGVLAAVSLPLFSKSRLGEGWLKNLHIEKIGLVLSLILLILVNWSVVWMIAIAGMVSMVIFENLEKGSRFRIRKLLLPMTVVILGVFLMVVNLNLNVLKNRIPAEVAPSFMLSKDIGMSVLKERMVFGYGMENFSIAFDKYGASRLSSTTLASAKFYDSTSEMVTLLIQGGLVMAAALGFLMWCLIRVLFKFKAHSLAEENSESVKEDMGILASMVALLVALFLYPFNITLMFLFYVFMALLVLAMYDRNKKEFNIEEKTSLSLASSLGFIGGLILVLVGIYFGVSIYVGDVKYAKALEEKDNETVTSLLVEAINWNGRDDRYYRSASQAALVLLNDELAKKQDAERDARIQNYVSTSISLAKRATEIMSRESLNWANLGFVYQNLLSVVDGVDKLSEEAYLKAGELRPGDAAYYHRIGMLYMSKYDLLRQLVAARRADPAAAGRLAVQALDKAEENLKKSIEVSPNFGVAIYNLGIVYERQGEIAEAIEQLEKIVPFNNNQPGLAFELALLYYRAGRKNDALAQLQKAVVLAPDYANARWYLALLHEERGNVDGAIEELNKILSVDVNKDNQVVLTKLQDLQSGKVINPPKKVSDQPPLQ